MQDYIVFANYADDDGSVLVFLGAFDTLPLAEAFRDELLDLGRHAEASIHVARIVL